MPDVTMSNEANEDAQLYNELAQMHFSLLQNVYLTLNDFDLSSDEARRRVLLFLHDASTHFGWGWAAPPTTQSTAVSPGHGTWRGSPGTLVYCGGVPTFTPDSMPNVFIDPTTALAFTVEEFIPDAEATGVPTPPLPDGHVPTTRPFSGTGRRLNDDVE